MKKTLWVSVLMLFISVLLTGQEWIVPDDRRGKLSTFRFSDETRRSGDQLYSINCKSCHGTPGRSNFINLVPPPGDPATEKIQKNRDGEIFYKVAEGREQMPSFKNVLSANEIWNIVSFIRSFNGSYKQEIMAVLTSRAYPGSEIKIEFGYNQGDTLITLTARAVNGALSVPVKDAAVRLFVHRTFGMLPVDDEKITDGQGKTFFSLPDRFPGDTAGNIMVRARFTNEDIFGTTSKDTILMAAEKTDYVSLVAERAMWNSVRKAPVWIMLTFTSGFLMVWGFIVYVLLKLRDIFIIGETVSEKATD